MTFWLRGAVATAIVGIGTLSGLLVADYLLKWHSSHRKTNKQANLGFVVVSSSILEEQAQFNSHVKKLRTVGQDTLRIFLSDVQQATGLPDVLVDVILDMIIQHCPGQDEGNVLRAIFCQSSEDDKCNSCWIAFSDKTETQLESLVRKMGCDMMVLFPTECREYLDALDKGE